MNGAKYYRIYLELLDSVEKRCVCSLFNLGELSVAFETGHAYGLKTREGKEVLIHLGIDTVSLAEKGFKSYVKQGDIIKQGQLLCEMDLELIQEESLGSTCMVVFTDGTEVDVQKLGQNVSAKEPELIKI